MDAIPGRGESRVYPVVWGFIAGVATLLALEALVEHPFAGSNAIFTPITALGAATAITFVTSLRN